MNELSDLFRLVLFIVIKLSWVRWVIVINGEQGDLVVLGKLSKFGKFHVDG